MEQEVLEEGKCHMAKEISLCLLMYFVQGWCHNQFLFSWQVIIFVDNSGADIILGVLPFARELLRRGSQVCTL